MTEGRRLLISVLQKLRCREVALRTHVTESAVSHWSSGRWKPSRRARKMLEAHVGIDAGTWDRPAHVHRQPSAPVRTP